MLTFPKVPSCSFFLWLAKFRNLVKPFAHPIQLVFTTCLAVCLVGVTLLSLSLIVNIQKVEAAPFTLPSTEIITGTTGLITHTTSPSMSVFGDGRITDQFLTDNDPIRTNQIGTAISATTVAVMFDQHISPTVDVGAQLDFVFNKPITLNTSSNIPGFGEDSYAVYASKVLSYQIVQQTLAMTMNNCIIMELVVSNTSSSTALTGGKLLYMVDMDTALQPIGDTGFYDSARHLVYQTDFNGGGFAMGFSLLQGNLRGYGIDARHYPVSDTELRSEMLTPGNPTRPIPGDNPGDNIVSWLVADLPDLAPQKDTLLAFALCARTAAGTDEEETQAAAKAALLDSFDQLLKLKVTKTSFPPAGSLVAAGESITYTVTLTNSGQYYLDNVVVTDAVPGSTYLLDYATSQGSVRDLNGIVTANVGRLDPNSRPVVLTITVTLPVTIANNRVISNQAFIQSESIVTTTLPVTHQTVSTASLRVEKAGPITAKVTDTAIFTFTVTNDFLRGNGTPISLTALSDNVTGPPLSLPLGDDGDSLLETGETWTYTDSYTFLPDDPPLLTNTITVTGLDEAGRVVVAFDTHTTLVTHNPVLYIRKQGPTSTVRVNDTVTYTFDIEHDRFDSDLSAVKLVSVTDDIAGFAISSSKIDQNNNHKLDGLGDAWRFVVTYTIPISAPDPLINTGTVTGIDMDGDIIVASDMHYTYIEYEPALTVTKTGPDVARIGDTAVFTFTVSNDTNHGDSSPITNVSVIDSLIGRVVNPIKLGGNSDEMLEMGETWIYTASYDISSPQTPMLVNAVTVTGKDLDREPVQAAVATHTTRILPALLVSKTGPDEAKVSDTVGYTFTLTNDTQQGSGAPVSITTIHDSLVGPIPPNPAIRENDDGDSYLEGGEVWTYTAAYTITYTAPRTLINEVTVIGKDEVNNIITATASHSTLVWHNPGLFIDKQCFDLAYVAITTAKVGETITCKFNVAHSTKSDDSPIYVFGLTDTVAGPAQKFSGDGNFLDGGETWGYIVTYTVKATDPLQLENEGILTGTDLDGDQITVSSSSRPLMVWGYEPILVLAKTGPGTAVPKQTIPYTFTLSHAPSSDGSPVKYITLTDSILPVPPIYTAGDTNNNNQLDASESWTYTGSYPIPAYFSGTLTNTATVTGRDPEADTITTTATHPTNVISFNPCLTLTEHGPLTVTVGQRIVFTYEVSQDGQCDRTPVYNVQVTDSLSGLAEYRGGDSNGSGKVEAGEMWMYRSNGVIRSMDPNPFANTITVTGYTMADQVITTVVTHPIRVEPALVYLPVIMKNYVPTMCSPYSLPNWEYQGKTVIQPITGFANRYMVEVDATATGGYEYGLLFGYRSPQFYRFTVRPEDKQFRVKQQFSNDLKNSTCIPSSLPNCWQPYTTANYNLNHLKVECDLMNIKLYLGNPPSLVWEKDGYDCSGGAGFFMQSTDPNARVSFTNFQLSCPAPTTNLTSSQSSNLPAIVPANLELDK